MTSDQEQGSVPVPGTPPERTIHYGTIVIIASMAGWNPQ
jgi:hypothetical protein